MNIIEGARGVEFVEVSSEDVSECLTYLSADPERRTLFLSRRNVSAELVSALLGSPKIDRVMSLSIMASVENLRLFEQCTWLTAINFGFEGSVFDFSKLLLLSRLGGVWSGKWTGLNKCGSLKSVHLSTFANSLSTLPRIDNLERLTLIQPKFSSLSGLELAGRINFLEISLAKHLVDVSALTQVSQCLEELTIDGCKKIASYEALRSLFKLNRLAITESSKLESLAFLNEMKVLRFFNVAFSNLKCNT